MVSISVILGIVGIFIAVGGIGLAKTAFAETQKGIDSVKGQLGKSSDDTSSQSPKDREIEDK